MLGCRSSGLRPDALDRGDGATRSNGGALKSSSAAKNVAEPEQHGGRVRRDVAQAPAQQEEAQRAPHRQQPEPQEQRALLRGPRGRGAVVPGGRRRGVRADDGELEVRAQERDLEDHERDRRDRGERVERAAAGEHVGLAAHARAGDGRADAVDAEAERDDQAGLADDAHRLRSARRADDGGCCSSRELRRALRRQRVLLADPGAAALAHVHDDLAALAERVRHGAACSAPARTRAVAVAHAEGDAVGVAPDRPVDDLAGQLVGLGRRSTTRAAGSA